VFINESYQVLFYILGFGPDLVKQIGTVERSFESLCSRDAQILENIILHLGRSRGRQADNRKISNFIDDFPIDLGEEYQPLRRALKRRRGFGLLFVRCSPAQGERLIARVRKDIPQKTVDVLSLDKPIDNLYEIIDNLPNKDKLDILFIKGIEKSLVDYIKPGIGGEGDYYKEDTVPRILGHLNLQRERFRDDFPISFVFLLPLYALKYFIRRAPDFFDWRSGVWEFPASSDLVEQEASRILSQINLGVILRLALPEQERKQKLLEIKELLTEEYQILKQKNALVLTQGCLFFTGNESEYALASFEQFLELQPNNDQIWLIRGMILSDLERYQEAIASYDKVLEIKPDTLYAYAWCLRGIALSHLERYEEAISSYDKALDITPDEYYVWYFRGVALSDLKRYEEAITSYEKALEIQPDNHDAWYRRGNALYKLKRYEEALASYDKALEIQPDNHQTWFLQGIALSFLKRYEEAITSYEKALKFKPDYHYAWYFKAGCYALQGNVDLAIENLQQAIKLNPDKYREKAKTNSDFDSIREDQRFQALIEG